VHQGKGALTVGGDIEAIKAKEMEARQRMALSGLAAAIEPELDQFMEAYHEMLVKFTQRMEPQLNSFSLFPSPEGRCATPFRPCASGRSATPTNISQRWAKMVAWRMEWGMRC
jgi:hypothetical protein